MEQSTWQQLKNWWLDHGRPRTELPEVKKSIADVEKFFQVAGAFPGWGQLTAQDGSSYLTTLSRTVNHDQLRHKWNLLNAVSDGLADLKINRARPFDPTHLFAASLRDERQYSSATIKAYTTDLRDCRQVLDQAGSNHQWAELDADDVSTYLMNLRQRHLKQSTILRKLSSLRSFYQFLEQNHLATTNPWELVPMKRQPAELPRYLYPPEIKDLLKTARGQGKELDLRNFAIVEMLLETGMRVGELVGLKEGDIDTSLDVILVNGKGGKQRYLPLGASVKKALSDYEQSCRQPLMQHYKENHHFVFINQYGAPITSAGITYILNELIKKSSLTGHIHPHMLRHTFATTMLNNGADIRSVQELLGHASLSTTQIYTHLTSKHLQDSYQRFFSRARKD